MEAECPLTIWCSAMTSSPPVGTYCLFPHNNVKRQNHTLHFFELRHYLLAFGWHWRAAVRAANRRLVIEREVGRRGGPPQRECSTFVFLTHAPVAVQSCTSKTSTAGVHSAQITAVWLVTCHVALKQKAASCDTAELSTVNSGIQPNHQPFTKSDAWWEKWPGLIPSGLQNGKR